MKYIKIPTNFIHIGLNTKKLLQVNNYLTFAVAYCGKVTTTMTMTIEGGRTDQTFFVSCHGQIGRISLRVGFGPVEALATSYQVQLYS